ncbi:MAG: ATP-dependent DNA ligase [Microbacteriaceae bacterium]
MVTLTKLRRHESFAISWRDDSEIGDGRSTVWITPSTDLHFKYSGSRQPMIEKERVEEMAAASNSTHGIQLDDDATLVEPPKR